jgi:hypothetical protein
MYQFTTTNVINSQYVKDYDGNNLLDANGTQIAKVTGSAAGLSFPKIGFFKKAGIVSISKRPYAAGVKEVAKITVPSVSAGLVYRLDVMLKLSASTQAEYANYTLDFQKPITVEVVGLATAALTCDALVLQLNGLKDRFGYKYFTAVKDSTANVQITCNQFEQRVKSMVILEEVASPVSLITPEYKDVSASTFSVTTAGKLGFGDDNWMQRRVMLQTLENTRYFGISKDERPVIGGNYTEYVLRYSITKDGNDGTWGDGTSVTTHVFYVISTEVARFEQEITDTGLTVPAVFKAIMTDADGILSTGADATDQITYTGNIGVVTFATSTTTTIAVGATTGLVTTAGKTATGPGVVVATDAVGNTSTVTYDVQA